MVNMKILHIGNTGGVGSVIAKYMDRLIGTKSLVVARRASDPYGLTIYGELWDCGAKIFALKCLWLARKFDVVHVHYVDKIVPFLKFIYPGKPVVLHYHGDDIRGKWRLRRNYWSKANVILYSTLDLLDDEVPRHAVYMPNPVDTEFFQKSIKSNQEKNSALAFRYHLDETKADRYALKHGVFVRILERHIPYKEMPEKLKRYEYYIDQTEIPSLSKTALEALACGLKVIRWDGEIVENLPEEHTPENVAKRIWRIYQQLTQKHSPSSYPHTIESSHIGKVRTICTKLTRVDHECL